MAAADYQTVRQYCVKNGQLYEDPAFPAVPNSIYYSKEDVNIVWKRPGEIVSTPKLIVQGSTRFDLFQGQLGNCWFVSASAILATRPELFKQVVPSDQLDGFDKNYAGVFHFRIWRFGEWHDVLVDDRLPTKDGGLIFCHNRREAHEFWGPLLEKAYAKLHGSYEALESGYAHEALVDFTGGIGEYMDLKDVAAAGTADHLFKRLLKIHKKMNTLIAAAIEANEDETYENKRPNGLVAGHAYSITNIIKLRVNSNDVKLLRVHNPWGWKEWTGAWSDDSKEWNAVSEETRRDLKLTTADEGEFWISFTDWLGEFTSLQLCHLTPDSVKGGLGKKKSWNTLKYHDSWVKGVSAGGCGMPPNEDLYWTNPQYFIKVDDPDEDDEDNKCMVIVSLMQKYRRLLKTRMRSEDDQNVGVGLDLYKFKGTAPELLDGKKYDEKALRLERKTMNYEYLRERSFRFYLSPGAYCIICCTYEPNTSGEFLIRILTQKSVQSNETSEPSEPPEPPKPSDTSNNVQIEKLFKKHAGEDDTVDHRELRRFLNQAFPTASDEEKISKETARALLMAYDKDRSGVLVRAEGIEVWKRVKELKGLFDQFDKTDNDLLGARELSNLFKSIGYKLSRKVQGAIVTRICGKKANIGLDDFILVATKFASVYEAYRRHERRRGVRGAVEFTEEEYLETSMLH